MKPNVLLTISSLLLILFLTFHIAGDIVFRFEPGGLSNLVWTVLITVVWLYGTLVLAERRSGYIIMTAQVTALYPSFLTAALTVGINPFVSALSLAYFSNLNASMTHYGTGSAPVYFGVGYVSQGAWWKVGFLISLVNLALWLGLGLLWWKLLGWW